MSRSFIYAQMAEGAFPRQIHLGPRIIVWNKQEVVQWMEDRIANR
ncbi:prophage CP4-57 regulatory family protein [Synechococcus sp. RS9902]|nr:prophage CP4-57 regulatory family protein [Synechococcus sp. RS9902]